MSRVEVFDYDPEWPVVYERLRGRIWAAVSELATGIEHVGSTAVPGLAAKPVIDIDIIVAPPRVHECIVRVEALGYEHRGNLGIAGREAFAAPAGSLRHHLYLCPSDSEALANHIAVRDALRSSAADARAYGDLKQRLAREFPEDIDGYVEGKTDFLLGLLARAGFSEEALRRIRGMNTR